MTSVDSLPPLSPEQRLKPAHFELRMAAMFALVFVPNGIHLPYFPLWLKDSGFSPDDIGLILSAPVFVRILAAAIIPARADRAADRVPIFLVTVLLSMFCVLGFLLVSGKFAVIAVSLLLAAVWSPHAVLADSIALSGVRRFGSDYASQRVWGSIFFVAANIVGGYVIAAYGSRMVIWMMAAGFAAMSVVVAAMPRLGRPRLARPLAGHTFSAMASFFPDRRFMLFVLASALIQGSHAQLYAFGSIEWKASGLSEDYVGWLWAVGVGSEVIMFFMFKRLFGRVSAPATLMVGAVISTLRWAAMAVAGDTGFGWQAMFALQITHAFTFTVAFMGMQRMMAETIPEERMGAAQGLSAFAIGVMLSLLMLVSGRLYAAYDSHSFLFMCIVSLAGLAAAWLGSRQPQSAGEGG